MACLRQVTAWAASRAVNSTVPATQMASLPSAVVPTWVARVAAAPRAVRPFFFPSPVQVPPGDVTLGFAGESSSTFFLAFRQCRIDTLSTIQVNTLTSVSRYIGRLTIVNLSFLSFFRYDTICLHARTLISFACVRSGRRLLLVVSQYTFAPSICPSAHSRQRLQMKWKV